MASCLAIKYKVLNIASGQVLVNYLLLICLHIESINIGRDEMRQSRNPGILDASIPGFSGL
jgi:hypothetical protein